MSHSETEKPVGTVKARDKTFLKDKTIMSTRGTLQSHLEWAEANAETTLGKNFLDLVQLYRSHSDAPTYGLLMAAAHDIEREWRRQNKAAPTENTE